MALRPARRQPEDLRDLSSRPLSGSRLVLCLPPSPAQRGVAPVKILHHLVPSSRLEHRAVHRVRGGFCECLARLSRGPVVQPFRCSRVRSVVRSRGVWCRSGCRVHLLLEPVARRSVEPRSRLCSAGLRFSSLRRGRVAPRDASLLSTFRDRLPLAVHRSCRTTRFSVSSAGCPATVCPLGWGPQSSLALAVFHGSVVTSGCPSGCQSSLLPDLPSSFLNGSAHLLRHRPSSGSPGAPRPRLVPWSRALGRAPLVLGVSRRLGTDVPRRVRLAFRRSSLPAPPVPRTGRLLDPRRRVFRFSTGRRAATDFSYAPAGPASPGVTRAVLLPDHAGHAGQRGP